MRLATFRTWRVLAWFAGAYCLLVGGTLLLSHLHAGADAPLKSPLLKEYQDKLRLTPADAELKKTIRELDLQLRRQYFRKLAQTRSGVYLLLGGIAVFVLALAQARQKRLHLPKPNPGADEAVPRAAAAARWSVAALGGFIGLCLCVLSFGFTTSLPKRGLDVEKLLGEPGSVEATSSDTASMAELRQNWPRFRGFDGGGVSPLTNAPANWDSRTGVGIAWKSPIPANGFGSPIVWNSQVFLSGGDANKQEVTCFDSGTGRVLWQQAISVAGKQAEVPETTGYAASTLATDGRRVYAIFANGSLQAFTLAGQAVWSRMFGPLKNPYGHATSLATWQGQLIVQLDQGVIEEGKSRLYSLDGRSGKTVWERPRRVGSSWASPIMIEAAGKTQIITLAVPWVIAYAADTGAELWRAECLNGEVTPSPIFAGGLLIITSPSEKMLAIRPEGQGDVTKTHIVWSTDENIPDVTSPVSNGELIFAVTSSGLLTCFDLKDGKKLWEHDFEMEFHASPSMAGNRLFLFSQKGTAVQVETAREFKELFRTEMGDAFHASPAFAPGRIFLRGMTNLWCLGAPVETPVLLKAAK